MSNTLKETTRAIRDELGGLLREVAYDTAREAGLSRATIDLDGTVQRTGLCAEGAARGFNPHHPKDKSYYPLTAHLAQTGQLLAVVNREGNVHDSERALETLAFLVEDVRRELTPRHLEARFDGAFFRRDLLDYLETSGIEYAIKAPLWDWLETRSLIGKRRRWKRIRPGLQAFFTKLRIPKWDLTLRVAVYRKHVSHRTRKNFQLDLFDPSDGHYEYSSVATNKRIGLGALWDFMAGRGGHEKTLGELKQHLELPGSRRSNPWGYASVRRAVGVSRRQQSSWSAVNDAAAIVGDEAARWEIGRSLGKEKRSMMKAFAVGVLGMMLCFVAPNPAASEGEALSGDEVQKLFAGNTELGAGRKGDIDTDRRWKAFYTADGSIRHRESGGSAMWKGSWFVDSEGRACFRWEGWDPAKETKCDEIIREDDHYLRVREGQVRGLIRIQEGNPANL